MSQKNSSAVIRIPKILQKKLNNKKISKIYRKFEKNLNLNNNFAVAVSGGPDSLALAILAKIYAVKKKLISKFFINSKDKIYDNTLSDEGGRFYHSQIRYMACKLNKKQNIKLPENYIWLSHNQIVDFIKKQKIDIEARLLFGIVNFKETI